MRHVGLSLLPSSEAATGSQEKSKRWREGRQLLRQRDRGTPSSNGPGQRDNWGLCHRNTTKKLRERLCCRQACGTVDIQTDWSILPAISSDLEGEAPRHISRKTWGDGWQWLLNEGNSDALGLKASNQLVCY